MQKAVTTVAEYADNIARSWKKGRAGYLEAANYCAEAKAKFKGEALKRLHEQLCLDKSTFSKLATIGGNNKMKEQRIRALLPGTISRLYAVALLEDDQIEAAVASGLLNPKATRADLDDFRRTGGELVRLYPEGKFEGSEGQEFIDAVERICAQFPVRSEWKCKPEPQQEAAVADEGVSVEADESEEAAEDDDAEDAPESDEDEESSEGDDDENSAEESSPAAGKEALGGGVASPSSATAKTGGKAGGAPKGPEKRASQKAHLKVVPTGSPKASGGPRKAATAPQARAPSSTTAKPSDGAIG